MMDFGKPSPGGAPRSFHPAVVYAKLTASYSKMLLDVNMYSYLKPLRDIVSPPFRVQCITATGMGQGLGMVPGPTEKEDK